MHRIHETIRIDAPVEHVWSFLCDTARWPDWDPRSDFSDFSGPIDTVGTTFVETMHLLGHDLKGTHEVIDVSPERLLHIRGELGPTNIFYRFEPEGDATLAAVEGTFETPGDLPSDIQALVSRHWMERYTHQQLLDFKALVEATVPVPA